MTICGHIQSTPGARSAQWRTRPLGYAFLAVLIAGGGIDAAVEAQEAAPAEAKIDRPVHGTLRLDSDISDLEHDILGIPAWQNLSERVEIHDRHTRMDGNGRNVFFSSIYRDTDLAFTDQASYCEILRDRRDHALELAHFCRSAFECLPCSEIRGFLPGTGSWARGIA